ncbi:polyprenyl synthetase family protein [Collinsella provencensis]|uniref:polyprenyl synthetase family protein n=1 Tax=Collinsella provencensis TaxID=1937461 RepID=UPI001F1B1D10|nr:polyprenyl synthetase family protein [Collinsella provencensis]
MTSSFVEYLKSRLPLVEKALAAAAPASLAKPGTRIARDLEDYLYDPLARFTASGGKRVRPALVLLGAEAAGGDGAQALSAAVAVELFQSAALIHDDIADESELRRGNPCVHCVEGTGVAINIGDLALTRVFEVVLDDANLPADRKLRVLKELARMERHTLEGQALDLGWARDGHWDITPEDYLYMVEGKTAWYTVASPLYLGALAAGASEDTARDFIEIGVHAGIAFQIQDDLLNLVGNANAQGKDFRSDITEGKRTLAVVSALQGLNPPERNELIALLRAGTKDPAELERAVKFIELGGGIEHCYDLAAQEAAQAQQQARDLVAQHHIAPEAGALLCDMADFFVNRSA